DKTLNVGTFAPEATSIQHAGIGTAMTSTGAAAGFFQGVVDEARIWNVARSQAQVQAAKDTDVAAPQAGLIGHWGLNEGAGTIANNTFGTANVAGTLANGPTWVAGCVPTAAHAATTVGLVAPADAATGLSTSPTLSATATDPEGQPVTVTFWGRPYASGVFAVAGSATVASGTQASITWTGRGG